MAPFVPRQRKHKRRQRSERHNDVLDDSNSNALVLHPTSSNEKDERKKALKETLRGQQPAMSSKKQKRLDRYIDKKLRKEENLDLIKKLAGTKVDTSLLRSSRNLGVGKESKRTLLSQAFQEYEAGINVGTSQTLLFEDRVVVNDDSDPSETSSAFSEPHSITQSPGQQILSSFGRGLKRAPETDANGRPIIKRRKRREPQLQGPAETVDSPWDGFSSSEDSDDSIEASTSACTTQGTQTDTDQEDEALQSASMKVHHTSSHADRRERTSAFKAWATQQVNESLGFTPDATYGIPEKAEAARPTLDFKPREPDHDPLPPELRAPSSTLERKAYSVDVKRSEHVQEARMSLPVVAEEQKIMEAVFNNACVVIWGATGSGKTTQVPQFLFESGFADPDGPTPGMIGVTQPRRVAAVSMSKRVGDELGNLQEKVSYQIRYESSVSKKTAIKFMTDGILLREIASDFALLKYSVIIIDEAHERSTNTDILIGMVSRIVELRAQMSRDNLNIKPLKLIIMSATLRIADFLDNPKLFRNGHPPLVKAEGRQYPVTIHFSRRTQRDYLEEIVQKVSRGHRKLPPGGMLVFLTGQNEIINTKNRLQDAFPTTPASRSSVPRATIIASDAPLEAEDIEIGSGKDNVSQAQEDSGDDSVDQDDGNDDEDFLQERSSSAPSHIHVLPLYSQLMTRDQMRVFEPPPENARLIVLATNIAETSLTIPGIRYVFDCGRAKEKKYDRATGVQSFEVDWISKASANQRAGRAGRTGPGHCYRLYSSAVFERDFDEYAEPEILRVPVEGVVLQLKSMNLQHVINFPFPTPPDRTSLERAEKLLMYIGALTPNGAVTAVGRELAAYPLSPRFSKMLVIGHQHACMPYTIAMVSALVVSDLFIPENQLGLSIPVCDTDAIYSIQEQLADESRERRKRDFNKAHSMFSKNSTSSDAIKALTALCAYAHAPDSEAFARDYFLNPKTLKEAATLRQQLSTIVHTHRPGILPSSYEKHLPQPSPKQLKALQQILAAAFIDQVAIRADLAPSTQEMPRKPSRAIDVPYLPLFKSHQCRAEDLVDLAVFIHPSSVLAQSPHRELPGYIIYSRLQRGTPASIEGAKKPRTRMHALASVTGKQIAALAKGTPLLEYGKPISKIMELEGGKRECWVVPEIVGEKGGRRWPLPALKVVQKKENNEGWIVERILS